VEEGVRETDRDRAVLGSRREHGLEAISVMGGASGASSGLPLSNGKASVGGKPPLKSEVVAANRAAAMNRKAKPQLGKHGSAKRTSGARNQSKYDSEALVFMQRRCGCLLHGCLPTHSLFSSDVSQSHTCHPRFRTQLRSGSEQQCSRLRGHFVNGRSCKLKCGALNAGLTLHDESADEASE
jgi:hypothetical protein